MDDNTYMSLFYHKILYIGMNIFFSLKYKWNLLVDDRGVIYVLCIYVRGILTEETLDPSFILITENMKIFPHVTNNGNYRRCFIER